MCVARMEERKTTELEELHATLAAVDCHRRKDRDELKGLANVVQDLDDSYQGRLVCVTNVSHLGLALVKLLLTRDYYVRIIVENQEDMGRLKEMETSGEIKGNSINFSAVMAKLTEVSSLMEAFEGCCGVFHTMSFTDPAGLSGYSKSMAEIEVKACENVMKACAETPTIRKCVLTSSLVACVWQDNKQHNCSHVVDHNCWSDESFCIERKLWYALGKLRAEKAAWRIAEERNLRLTTICPGLITGPEFSRRNPTSTIAYLKGAQEMYANGLLATIDVSRVAEAHVHLFEAMNKTTAFGRYICFDRIIKREDEAKDLAKEVGVPTEKICGNANNSIAASFQLSSEKLTSLMSRTARSCYEET